MTVAHNPSQEPSPNPGGSKVIHLRVPSEAQSGADPEVALTSGSEAEVTNGSEAEMERFVGVASILSKLPDTLRVTDAAEIFPWGEKHIRGTVSAIAEGLNIDKASLLNRGVLSQKALQFLASYEADCGAKLSVFNAEGRRIDVVSREGLPRQMDEWLDDRRSQQVEEAVNRTPIGVKDLGAAIRDAQESIPPSNQQDLHASSSLAVINDDEFDIDAFIDSQLNAMDGVEGNAIQLFEQVEAEIVETQDSRELLQQKDRAVQQRTIAAQAVQDAAKDVQLYQRTYDATQRKLLSRLRSPEGQGKPQGEGGSPT